MVGFFSRNELYTTCGGLICNIVLSIFMSRCIFLWRLPSEFTECMMGRIGQQDSIAEMQDNESKFVNFLLFKIIISLSYF